MSFGLFRNTSQHSLGSNVQSVPTNTWTDSAATFNQPWNNSMSYSGGAAGGSNFGFGSMLGAVQNLSTIGNNLTSLFGKNTMGAGQLLMARNMYKLGKQNLALGREKFGFEKALANRNIANQAKIINNQYNNAARMSAALMGGDPALTQQYLQKTQQKHVDASPVG